MLRSWHLLGNYTWDIQERFLKRRPKVKYPAIISKTKEQKRTIRGIGDIVMLSLLKNRTIALVIIESPLIRNIAESYIPYKPKTQRTTTTTIPIQLFMPQQLSVYKSNDLLSNVGSYSYILPNLPNSKCLISWVHSISNDWCIIGEDTH